MRPFEFTGGSTANVLAEMVRFELAGQKPSGWVEDHRKRLACYLFQQRRFVEEHIKKRFPKTWQDFEPTILPVCQYFVDERAKVFLDGAASLALVNADDKPLGDEDPARKIWTKLQEERGLGLILKRIDRYATLHSTCFQSWGHSPEGVACQATLPLVVDVAWDPNFPFDLDRAYCVRVELPGEALEHAPAPQPPAATQGGFQGVVGSVVRRFQVWCARTDGAFKPFYAIVRGDGTLEDLPGNESRENPYTDDAGKPIVPLVMFTQHTQELGAFTLAGQGLADFDIAFAVELSNLQLVAEANGYGQLVITTSTGGEAPKEFERGPTRAIPLPEGSTAAMLSGNAPIADLVQKALTNLRMAALMHHIPPGSVSIEAQAASSGIALQVELRPLIEARADAIDTYKAPVRRMWRVAKAVWNRYAKETNGEKEIPKDIGMRWTPGEVQIPADPHIELDDDIVEISNNLATREEKLAKRRKIPLAEAEKLLPEIVKKNAASRAASPLSPIAKDQRLDEAGNPVKPPIVPPGAQRRIANGNQPEPGESAPPTE